MGQFSNVRERETEGERGTRLLDTLNNRFFGFKRKAFELIEYLCQDCVLVPHGDRVLFPHGSATQMESFTRLHSYFMTPSERKRDWSKMSRGMLGLSVILLPL